MYQCSKDKYVHIPFSIEFSPREYYVYERISDLVIKCDKNREEISKCRTIGILESKNGIFYLKDINLDSSNSNKSVSSIQVSMIFLKQYLPSTVKPQTIQIFGTLQWEKIPMIYANIVQTLIPPIALQLSETMQSVANRHLVKHNSKSGQGSNEPIDS